MKKRFSLLGLMSGSSLDGLDVAFCHFETAGKGPDFLIKNWQLESAGTLPFSEAWQETLRGLPTSTAFELMEAHAQFGHYLGQLVHGFCSQHGIPFQKIDAIASHGHTILHEPAKGFTLQIGDGAALAHETGCPVLCDFRSADVALGGQGAPLAPMADRWLYPGYDFYLNLGGIANVSCPLGGKFVAFDVTGVNQILNALAALAGLPYDDRGQLAGQGKLDENLLKKLDHQPFFKVPYPKSLSNQWVQQALVQPALHSTAPVADRLHTTCQHVARQLCNSFSQIIEKEHFIKEKYRLLATGGGVFNDFLMDCIRLENPAMEVVVPDDAVVKFKEACLMALLGLLRLNGVPNCMASVTGASKDAIGGALYLSA